MEKKTGKLLEKRERLLQKLVSLRLLPHGAYLERFSTCIRKNRAFHRGDRHGSCSYVVIYRDGQQRQVYVPLEQVRVIQHGRRQDEQAAELIRQITDVNLTLMHAGLLEASGGPAKKEGA